MPQTKLLQLPLITTASSDMAALVITLRRHTVLLALGPLSAALIALLFIGWMPKQYVSTATVDLGMVIMDASDSDQLAWKAAMTKTAASLMASPSVQQTATKAMGSPTSQLPDRAVKVKAGAPDGLIVLTVKAPSPELAQQIAEALLEATYAASKPNENERLRLEEVLRQLGNQLDFLKQMLRRLHQALEKTDQPQSVGPLATAVLLTQERIDLLEKRAALIRLQRQALTKAALATGPTLPTSEADPHRGLWAGIAALATLLALISALLIRQTWREMGQTGVAPPAKSVASTVAESA